MFKSIEGIYNQGHIELREIPDNIPQKTKVIVTFLTSILESPKIINDSPLSEEYHDLDHLAGTWTEDDEVDFFTNINSY